MPGGSWRSGKSAWQKRAGRATLWNGEIRAVGGGGGVATITMLIPRVQPTGGGGRGGDQGRERRRVPGWGAGTTRGGLGCRHGPRWGAGTTRGGLGVVGDPIAGVTRSQVAGATLSQRGCASKG